MFQEAGFLPAETVTVPDQRPVERTIDDIVARVFSTSSTAPHLPDNILRIWRLPA